MSAIDIGIEQQNSASVAQALQYLLADLYSLYLQTQNFHWNVTGARSAELHTMFKQQYTELAAAVDKIAEHIRTLGHPAPGRYSLFSQLNNIEEVFGVPSASEMIAILKQNHEHIVRKCREVLHLAQQTSDESTEALVSDRMRVHEKTARRLRALAH